jgi:hypothetical protein
MPYSSAVRHTQKQCSEGAQCASYLVHPVSILICSSTQKAGVNQVGGQQLQLHSYPS